MTRPGGRGHKYVQRKGQEVVRLVQEVEGGDQPNGDPVVLNLRGRAASILVSRSRIGDQVAAAILHDVVVSDATAETFLPPEKDLAHHYGVGRSAIREALSLLVTANVVQILHGKGTVIEPESQWDVLSPLVMKTLEETGHSKKLNADLFEVRRILEDYAAGFAATKATTAERQALTAKANQLVREASDPLVSTLEFLATDREFHDLLATISGNVALRQIIREMHVHLATAWTDLSLSGDERSNVAQQHVSIASAILSGDVEATRLAMTMHMNNVEDERQRGN
jgi:DNA-binding FadR family transcriptional regulator